MSFSKIILATVLIIALGIFASQKIFQDSETGDNPSEVLPAGANVPTLETSSPTTAKDNASGAADQTAGSARQEPLTPLQTKDLKVGSQKQVVEGSKISFNIVVKLQDGKIVFDSYKDGRPWQGTIGDGSILTGIDRGLIGMFQGGKRALWIPPHMAFGPSGITHQVPPNAKLYAEVDLISVY